MLAFATMLRTEKQCLTLGSTFDTTCTTRFRSQSVVVCPPIAFMCLAVALRTTFSLALFILKRVNVIYCFDFSDVMQVVSLQEHSMLALAAIRSYKHIYGATPCEIFFYRFVILVEHLSKIQPKNLTNDIIP